MTGTSTSATPPNILSLLWMLLKADSLKDLAPVAIGALTIVEKTPGALGLLNAKLYILGNAPAALLQLEQDFIGQAVGDLQADVTAATAQAQAAITAAQASATPAPAPATA